MGCSASAGRGQTSNTAACEFQNGSDSVLQCEKCKCDAENVFYCKQCQQTICSACCVHLDTKHAKVTQQPVTGKEQYKNGQVENRFYECIIHTQETHALPINSSKAFQKKVRCGTVVQNGDVAFLCQLSYQGNKFCNCCTDTFKWKLCYLHDKASYMITKRKHNIDKSRIFPGDICYVEKRRKIYLTLPCKRMVYNRPVGKNFHEAFSTPLGECFGITAFTGGLALSIKIPTNLNIAKWQIQFVNFKGKVSQRIQTDSKGRAIFTEPLFLTSNKERNILFVSDYGKSSVFAFAANGDLLFDYHGINVVDPLGIAADMYNNIYVACRKTVIQIDAGGAKSTKLLDGEDKIASVCMDFQTNTLFLISEFGNVSSFEFE